MTKWIEYEKLPNNNISTANILRTEYFFGFGLCKNSHLLV